MECTKKDSFKPIKEAFISKNFETLEELRRNGLFFDLILVDKDGVEFKVHKSVMYSGSGYFKGILSSGMKESSAERIVLEFISGHTLEHIISFMYEGELKTEDPNEIEEIAELSYFLQIEELLEICTLLLQNLIDNNNCLKYWRLADRLTASAGKLEEKCIVHILQCAEQFFEDPSFLTGLTVEEIRKLLADDRLPLSEECVFKSALKWARNENKMFHEVIDYIRFPLMSKQFLSTDVLRRNSLMEDITVMKKIIDCARYKWTEESEGDIVFSELTSPRIGLRQKGFLAKLGSDVVSIPSEGEIENLQVKPNYRELFGYTTFNNFLFICCGREYGQKEDTSTCSYLSPITREWKRFPPMKNSRTGHQCVSIDSKIYVCGGQVKSVEMFDLATGSWSTGPCMNSATYWFGLTSPNRSLYAIGGSGSSSVEFFDPRSSDGWTIISDEFSSCDYTQCISIGTDIYCFRRKDHVYIFDILMNKRRKWDSDCSAFQQNEIGGFRVCELNGDFGVIFPKGGSVDFLKYNTKGEIILKQELNRKCKPYTHTNSGVNFAVFSCSLSTLYH